MDATRKMTTNLKVYPHAEALAENVGELIMRITDQSVSNPFHLAISGGSTPNLLFTAWASGYADSELWRKIHFWWVDERMVGPGDPESNYGNARKLLFSNINIPERNIHRIRGEQDPAEEATSYAGQISGTVPMKRELPRFDLILLGMGEDGHTASIFPGHTGLLHSDQICEVAFHPVSLQKRITLTGKVINNAKKIFFLCTGANKAERLAEIWMNGEKRELLPASHIQPVDGELCWFTDTSAARLII